MFPPENVI